MAAPISAPTIVNISRNMPIFRFVKWSRTYAAAEPLEVAMTEMMLTAIAFLIGKPKRVRNGMRTTPPPIPLMAPTKPATIEMEKREIKETDGIEMRIAC